jgi:hypothetical protein
VKVRWFAGIKTFRKPPSSSSLTSVKEVHVGLNHTLGDKGCGYHPCSGACTRIGARTHYLNLTTDFSLDVETTNIPQNMCLD